MKTILTVSTLSLGLLALPGITLAEVYSHYPEHSNHLESTHPEAVSSHHRHEQGVAIPIGVMGSHMHRTGEWMITLSIMGSGMGGLLNQTTSVTAEQALHDFSMVPQSMLMGMPMLGVMYALQDWLTLMAMVPDMGMHMNHIGQESHMHTMQAMRTTLANMSSGGLGDISLSALVGNWQFENHTLHLNLGLSLPTGAIDLSQPSMNNSTPQVLPYSMRLGSGTWDLLPALTYTGHAGPWCWGLQPGGTIRLGTNALNYRLGHRLEGSGWLGYRFNHWLSASLRLQGYIWGNAEGADIRLDKTMIPAADPARLGGQRLDLLLGLNFVPWPGQRLGLEGGVPIYQSLSGPQLATQWIVWTGWQTSFY